MNRLALTLAIVVLLAAAGAVSAATAGFTTAERKLAIEFQKRLTEIKEFKVEDKAALALARVYLRRAYVVDVRPAQVVATEVLSPGRRVTEADQAQYLGWALDALVNGAKLEDVRTTVKELLESDYTNADKLTYAEAFLGVASAQVSPLPLLSMMRLAYKDGLVGARLRDFMSGVLAEVRRGEDPAYMLRIHQAIRKLTPLAGAQRDFIAKCYRGVRQGVPPSALADAVTALSQKYESDRLAEADLDKIFRLFLGGATFDESVKQVMPPAKGAEK